MQKKCSFADISSQLMPDYLAQLVTKHNSANRITRVCLQFHFGTHPINKLDRVRTAKVGERKSVKLISPEKSPALTAYNPTNGARLGKQVRRGTNRGCG